MADEIPAQISATGLDGWYTELSSQDKVRVRRYLNGIDTSSSLALIIDLMGRAGEDHNYKLAVTAGEYLEAQELSDLDRYRVTEALIEGMFGNDMFEEAKAMCVRNLELYPKVAGQVPIDRMSCRNRLIDILVGVDGNYDAAYQSLDTFLQMGLIDESERDYRKQSLKVHRMQRSFDNIFNYRKSE
ncbi:MAG: hypothetical protein Q4Q58_06290 [Thermoplasmata archaeon]|nr:hypothetical protein [Thermoplasmata archaeon]